MKLYLVRHGQTIFNVRGRVQGWCDSPLTLEGISMAKKLGEGLVDVDFVHAYSSTSERAIDTLDYILNDCEVPRTALKELKEMNFGTLEGELEKEVMAPDGSTHQKGFMEFGGETLEMVESRLLEVLERIAKKHPDGNVLVVSHGGAILGALLGVDAKQTLKHNKENGFIKNCSVSILSYEDAKFAIDSISDTSYLK